MERSSVGRGLLSVWAELTARTGVVIAHMGVSCADPATQRRSCWREKCLRGAAAAETRHPQRYIVSPLTFY